MDADAPRTHSSATASLPDLRLHDPDRAEEPVTLRFPQIPARSESVETSRQRATIVLGTTRKSQAELNQFRHGDLIVLDQPDDAPLALIWQGAVVAWVELAKVAGQTVWKVVELASRETKEARHE